jgi:hypothetical protein
MVNTNMRVAAAKGRATLQEQAERPAAMTPDELAAHKPGPASAREPRRQDRDARRFIDELLQDDEPGRDAALTGGGFE